MKHIGISLSALAQAGTLSDAGVMIACIVMFIGISFFGVLFIKAVQKDKKNRHKYLCSKHIA